MSTEAILRAAVKELGERQCQFALAGGLAAAVYRTRMRATTDVDMLLLAPVGTSLETAEEIIRGLGFSAARATLANLCPAPRMGKHRLPPLIVVGRNPADAAEGLDFILPEMPWFESALQRSRDNLLDFGDGPIPALTPEDLLISKLYALSLKPSRFDDLSDIADIFHNATLNLDLAYICGRMERLKLSIPRELDKEVPAAVRVLAKRLRTG